MKKMILAACVLLAIVGTLMSCASLFKGPNQKVGIGSIPDKAKVYVNGQFMGETPLELNLQSKQNYAIEFRKEGYTTKTVLLNNRIGAGWVVLDIVMGLIPVIVDAATGDWMYLDQTNVNAVLEKQQ